MIRTTIIAGGLLGLGILGAAPAMAAPNSTVSCSPPAICPAQASTAPVPGIVQYYTGNGPGTAKGDLITALTTGPATAVGVLVTGPATAVGVWKKALVGG